MSARPSDRFIPWYFVLFFAFLTVVFGGFAYIAHTTHPGVVTEQAYEKGLQYNSLITRADAQARLGWSSAIDVTRAAAGSAQLSLTLRDAQGAPVTGMAVQAVVARPSKQAMDFRVTLAEQSPGVYAAAIHPPAAGLWEMQVSATGAKGDYQASKRVELPHD
jgi:nitrogen fixation protein FixH